MERSCVRHSFRSSNFWWTLLKLCSDLLLDKYDIKINEHEENLRSGLRDIGRFSYKSQTKTFVLFVSAPLGPKSESVSLIHWPEWWIQINSVLMTWDTHPPPPCAIHSHWNVSNKKKTFSSRRKFSSEIHWNGWASSDTSSTNKTSYNIVLFP